MQQQFLQVFHHAYSAIKVVIYIVLTITLGRDLSHGQSPIQSGIVLGAVFASLVFFDPIVEVLLQASLIALIVLVAHGYCSNPTLETGVRACAMTAGETAFDAITDVIHRLFGLTHHSLPKVIET
jgi:chromate transport protein ChrA